MDRRTKARSSCQRRDSRASYRGRESLGRSFHEVLQTQLGDFRDFLQSDFDLLLARVSQTNREGARDRLLLIQSGADNEGKSEAFSIFAVVFAKLSRFFGGCVLKAGACLFAFRCGCQLALADEIGMSADEADLLVIAGFLDGSHERGMESFARRKRTQPLGAGSDPGRVLENGPDDADKFHPIHRIQLGQLWHRLVGVNELILGRNGEANCSSLREGAGPGLENPAGRSGPYAEGPRHGGVFTRRFRIVLYEWR